MGPSRVLDGRATGAAGGAHLPTRATIICNGSVILHFSFFFSFSLSIAQLFSFVRSGCDIAGSRAELGDIKSSESRPSKNTANSHTHFPRKRSTYPERVQSNFFPSSLASEPLLDNDTLFSLQEANNSSWPLCLSKLLHKQTHTHSHTTC